MKTTVRTNGLLFLIRVNQLTFKLKIATVLRQKERLKMQLKKICPVEWFVFALIVGFVLTIVGVWSKTIWLIALGFIILGTCVVLLVRFVYKGYKIMRTLQDDPVDSFLGDYH